VAAKAAKAVKKNTFAKTRKPRYSVVFHRPKTLKRTREPKYLRTRCVPPFCEVQLAHAWYIISLLVCLAYFAQMLLIDAWRWTLSAHALVICLVQCGRHPKAGPLCCAQVPPHH